MMALNAFEELNCTNIETYLKDFRGSCLKFFREDKLIFLQLRRNEEETLVCATGSTIRIALERANSYVSNGNFTMPTLSLSINSKLDDLVLNHDAIISISYSNDFFVSTIAVNGHYSEFNSSNVSLAIFLSMLEDNE